MSQTEEHISKHKVEFTETYVDQRPNTQEDEISLKELILKLREWWKYLLSKWLIILVAFLVGGVLGGLYAHNKTPLYNAICTFVLEEGGSGAGKYAGLASMVGIELGGGGNGIFQGNNIFELYKSNKMIKSTLLSSSEFDGKRELLINRYIEISELKARFYAQPDFKTIQFDQNYKDSKKETIKNGYLNVVIEDIRFKCLTIEKLDKETSIIKVSIRSPDEQFSRVFNDRIVKAVNDFYIQTKTKNSSDNLNILQHQTDSVRRELNNAIKGVAVVIDQNPNINPAMQTLRVPAQKRQVDIEANKSILTELVKNLEMSKISLRQETPLIQIIDQPSYPLEYISMPLIRGTLLGVFLFGFLIVLFLAIQRIIIRL
ncbi:GumC domain-containing protein [Pedobacter arcticus]|uniref:hypothetical protein n=1 Tax=Pedobacter arcticus TaxID=752140 RepID=UPI0003112591|nr:hypothetical protein [Pedobacter arcticus]